MDRSTERVYKRKCFQGRGWTARWLDRVFFALLCGVCLYISVGRFFLSLLLAAAVLLLLTFLDMRRWDKFRQKLWQDAADRLRRETWLRKEAERIRQAGGIVLFPTPDRDALLGFCFRYGLDTVFHGFGEGREDLITEAAAYGCTLVFHPWGKGEAPSREQVTERLRQEAPKGGKRLWRMLLNLPGNRYLLTGGLLLLLSVFFRRALYWRLLGSLCLLIGAFRRSFPAIGET